MNLKNQLRRYLEHMGLNPSQLARESGVPNATIADWLAGRKPRNIDQTKKVADVFKISLDHLLYGDGLQKVEPITDIEAILGDGWIGGVFEVKLRRVKKGG